MLKNKIIIIPIEEPWDHSADFLRQTALTLSKHNLVYIYDQNNNYFFLKKNKKLKYPQHKNIIFNQVKYFLPFKRLPIIDKINRLLSFKLFLIQHNKKDKILWIFNPNYFDLPKIKGKNTISIYDCVDYSENQQKERRLINNVDYFFVNSKALEKLHSKKDLNKQAMYISAQGFYQPDDKKIKKVRLKQDNKKAIIGYVGGINCRLDYQLLDRLITNHPEYLFVFYGPEQTNPNKDKIYQTQAWIKKLKKHKNTLFGCSNDRNYVYGLINNFDMAIIPYNLNLPFNLYCYPMKIFEYFYLSKPVISTAIEELKDKKFKSLIEIGSTAEEWEKYIEKRLLTPWPKKHKNKQHQMAINNSWEKKIETICQFL